MRVRSLVLIRYERWPVTAGGGWSYGIADLSSGEIVAWASDLECAKRARAILLQRSGGGTVAEGVVRMARKKKSGLQAAAAAALDSARMGAWGDEGTVTIGVPLRLVADGTHDDGKKRQGIEWCPVTETASGIVAGDPVLMPGPAVLRSEFAKAWGSLHVVRYEGEGQTKAKRRVHRFTVARLSESVKGLPKGTSKPAKKSAKKKPAKKKRR